MTHTSTEQPSLAAIIRDLRESHARTSPGAWGKGATTHETVSRAEGLAPYKVAEFRHANDAQFCDLAHVFVPRLLSEIEALQSRVNELEAQLSATHPTTQGLDAAVRELIDRLQDAQQDINLAANTHMSQQLASAAALLDEVESTLRALSATQPAAQGLELANCKGGKWLTVVYHDIQPGDESRTIGEHPKVSALSWSHALNDRDAALAAQAKHGEAQQ